MNTVVAAELNVAEYSAGSGQAITFRARPGFQFDPTSDVSAQSATIGFNGNPVNAVATVTPTGAADDVISFELTSGTSPTVQDIIRVNGIRVRILDAAGAAGPARITLEVTTTTAGGAFESQGIVAANIVTGAAQRLIFSTQPGSNAAGSDLLPAVCVVDFGGNTVKAEPPRTITLAIQDRPHCSARRPLRR